MNSRDPDPASESAQPRLVQRVLGLTGSATGRPWPRRVLFAVAVALAAGYGTLALGRLAERSIFLLSFLAIAAAGLYGGFAGAAVATATAALFAALWLLPPAQTLGIANADDRLRLLALVAAGTLIALLCELLHRSIRKLLEGEAALRESEESYRTLFHNLSEMVYIQDFEGRFLAVNDTVLRTFGYRRNELVGETPARLIDSERTDPGPVLAAMQAAAAGQPQLLECWAIRRDGSSFPKEVALARGRYFGRDVLIAVARDVSARKEAEAALARSQEQLRQAQKMEAVGRLAGGVAHDFNNLLTAIKGNAELALLELAPGSPAQAEVREISATADRAAALTRQLLAFGRKQVLQPRLLDLNAVLADTERMLRRVIGTDVELVARPAPEPACVQADPGQMAQVILNLVVNARDAVPRGGRICVEIGTGVLTDPDSLAEAEAVVLAVSDTGPGIPPEVLKHIFEPFFTTKSAGKGTGLGLSTVYGIVRQSSGDIQVESSAERGTCFRVLLPRAAGAPASAPLEAAPAVEQRGSGTILLVEDDPAVRSLTERVLRRGGYQVLAAAGGNEALGMLRDRRVTPDLLLTDVQMPEMTGPELAARLQLEIPDLPVLFVTGYTPDHSALTRAAHSGARLLEKPYTAETLLRHVADGLATCAA